MARASTRTLLSLDRYARIMGINPAHFNQVFGTELMPVVGGCNSIWYQHEWQSNDAVSREEIALAIHEAENDIAELLGYWPAPKWIDKEMHVYPHHHRKNATSSSGRNPNGYLKGIKAKWGKFIVAGQRALEAIGTATVAGGTLTFIDEDGDGVNETAQIVLATTYTDVREIKTFFAGHSGAEEWEIRPPKAIAISGGNVTIKFWIWQLVDPDLWEALTTVAADGVAALDITDANNYVTSVEVYREYTDFGEESCQFFWEPTEISTSHFACTTCAGAGCPKCALIVQDGCIHVRNVDAGLVVPSPGRWDATNGWWVEEELAICREPDQIKLWYYAGDLSDAYLEGGQPDPLADKWAKTIAYLATARLERPLCACGGAKVRADDLQVDLAFTPSDGGTYAFTFQLIDNPFGTRKGEVMAWKNIMGFSRRVPHVAVV